MTGNTNHNRTFTTAQVAEILFLPLRKVITFEERGYVTPSVQGAAGHGSKRLWSYLDLVRCSVIKSLLNGLSVSYLRVLSGWLRDDEMIQPSKLWLVKLDHGYPPYVTEPPRPFILDESDKYVLVGDDDLELSVENLLLSQMSGLTICFKAIHQDLGRRLPPE